jgi:hypothetical protein
MEDKTMRTSLLIIALLAISLVIFPMSAYTQTIEYSDLFITPQHNPAFFGGYVGGDGNTTSGFNSYIDWSVGNGVPFNSYGLDDMIFSTNVGDFLRPNDWLERMRITKDGYVGIGTADPSEILHVEGNLFLGKANESTRYIKMPRTAGGNNGNLEIQAGGVTASSGTAWQGGNLVLRAGDLNTAGIYWEGYGAVKIYAGKNQLVNRYNGDIIFYAGYNYDERLRIIGDTGRVGIGTASPAGTLDVNGSIYQRGNRLYADYVFSPEYKLESIEEHTAFMRENRHLKAIPEAKVDENGLEFIELGSHSKGIVEELEKAHIYIEQLHAKITEMEARLKKLEVKD